MKPVVIYGIGDFAIHMKYNLSQSGINVSAFSADSKFIKESTVEGLSIEPFEVIEEKFPPKTHDMLIAIGYNSMRNREILFERAKLKGYKLINYFHPKSVYEDDLIFGENNIVLANAVIEPKVCLGDNNVIWTSAVICHDSKIGSHNFFAAQSLVGGFSEVGNKCFFGFNSTAIHRMKIADETLVAAKSLVMSNTKSFCKYKGIPAVCYGEHVEQGIKI